MKQRNTQHGYTLIEMAIALSVLGMLTGMLLTMMTGKEEAAAIKAQKQQMKTLDEALAYHVKRRGRLPCPAAPTLAETDAAFGREDCSLATISGASANEDLYIGIVPTRSLGVSDRLMYDRWGNRIGYMVIKALTTDALSFANYVTTEQDGVIHIMDAAGNQATQAIPDRVVAYALVSYGKDKKGGYNRVGAITEACGAATLDSENCDGNDKNLIDAEINDTRFASTFYHDIVRWKDLAQLRAAVSPDETAYPQYAYVVDTGNDRVQKFDMNGNFVLEFGVSGTTNPGEFNAPTDIAVDGSGNLYVTDTGNNRVQVFDDDGNYINGFGSAGNGNLQFDQPEGIAVDTGGNIYVVDRGNNRVQKISSSYVYVTQFGVAGNGDGQFNQPEAIALGPSGNVYITDSNNNRVQMFSSSGVFISKFGSSGSGNGQLDDPDNLAISESGDVLVTDKNNHRVQRFDPTGNYLSKFGASGASDGEFNGPTGIAISRNGNIWVSDYNNARVQIFSSGGVYMAQFGVAGNGPTEFNSPEGIVIQ